MSALVAAAAWASVALCSVIAETEARLSAHGGELRVDGRPTARTGELALTPRLTLLREGPLALSIGYLPRLTLPIDLSAGSPELTSAQAFRDRFEILHRGEVAADAAATPNLTLRLRAEGESGRIDLLRTEIYAREVLPTTASRVDWRAARARFDAVATPSQRTTVTGGGGVFFADGGEVVPLQRGVRADGALRFDATRRDVLSATIDGSWARSEPQAGTGHAALLRGGGGWAHQLSETLTGRGAGGAAWSHADAALAGASSHVVPWLEAALAHASGRPHVDSELAARLSPVLSPLTATVDQRLEVSATTRLRAARDWELGARADAYALRAGGSGVAFWTGDARAEAASLEARASWAFARRGTLTISARGRGQRGHGSDPTFVDWGATIDLTVGSRWSE